MRPRIHRLWRPSFAKQSLELRDIVYSLQLLQTRWFTQPDPVPQPQRKTTTLKSKTASPWLDVENIGLNPDIPEKFTTIDNDLETVSELTDDDIVEEIYKDIEIHRCPGRPRSTVGYISVIKTCRPSWSVGVFHSIFLLFVSIFIQLPLKTKCTLVKSFYKLLCIIWMKENNVVYHQHFRMKSVSKILGWP